MVGIMDGTDCLAEWSYGRPAIWTTIHTTDGTRGCPSGEERDLPSASGKATVIQPARFVIATGTTGLPAWSATKGRARDMACFVPDLARWGRRPNLSASPSPTKHGRLNVGAVYG